MNKKALLIMIALMITTSLIFTGIEQAYAGDSKISLNVWKLPLISLNDFNKLIEEYKEIAPDVDIQVTELGWKGISEKVNIAIASNTFPDVYIGAVNRLLPLAVKGVTAPLDEYITEDFQLDDYTSAAIKLATFDDKLYFIPMGAGFYNFLLVNKTLFKEAGVSDLLPDEKTRAWSRDQFAKAVKAISELGIGIYGFALPAGRSDQDKFIDGYIYSDGDSYTNETYDKVIYNSKRNIKNFEWLINLTKSKASLPGSTAMIVDDFVPLFKRGKIGVINNTGNYYFAIQNGLKDGSINAPLDLMIAHFPTWDGKPAKVEIAGEGMAIKKQGDKRKEEAAARFVLWLNNPSNETAMKILKARNSDARKLWLEEIKDKEWKKKYDILTRVSTSSFPIPGWSQMRDVWFPEFQSALLGVKSAEEALDTFAQKAQEILNEAKTN